MNKDVVYIEPEDDITDILTKVKHSQNKIVALVPPKKAGVMRSVVNFKLIAKTARAAEKTVVLISTDESLIKLAAATQIPVAKNLQSKPELADAQTTPTTKDDSDVIDEVEADAIVASTGADNADSDPNAKGTKTTDEAATVAAVESVDLELDDASDDEVPTKKLRKSQPKVPDFKKYRKFIIAGIVALILLVGFLFWAFAIAPAARIAVTVRTTPENFSENISFVTDPAAADPANGIFLLEEQTLTKTSSVEFTATGEVDKGNKASGTLTLKRTSISNQNAVTIPAGTKFTYDGELVYVSSESVTLRAITDNDCNGGPITGCTGLKNDITATIKVVAEFPGTDYNIPATNSGWTPSGNGYSISGSAMSGGTSQIVKVVSEEDIKKAQSLLNNVGESEGKAELLANFPSGLMPIEASFKMTSKDAVSDPALDAEVADGVTPKLTSETTFTMYGVDSVKLSEYIESVTMTKLSGAESQKVYSTGVSDNKDENKAFIESFREVDGKYTAKLKTTTQVGPEVTDAMVAEKTLGKKIGEVQTLLKSINGISSVNVDTSFFWVNSIPDDINKVTIEITVE